MTLPPDLERVAVGVSTEFFLPGFSREDMRQEARAAALVAVRDWRPGGLSQRGFVGMVVRLRFIALLQQAARRPLNQTVELEPWMEPPAPDTDALLELRTLLARLTDLSPIERRVVVGWALGLSYTELGPVKQVDNALQRALRKLTA